ncbi:MBOAT family protein, partial [Aliarcobacter cryaerophilus]|nr:MBOAT family protein [Aliarcobacter cryaerophilus]
WIFFRAKDFESAMKVLGSMFSLDNVVLPEKYFKFLAEYNDIYFRFGAVYEDILGKDKTTYFILAGFIITLLFKNSMEKIYTFKANYFIALITLVFLIYTIFLLNQVSEFLYFNF